MDLDQLQRARPDLEQVVVDVEALAFEGGVADRLQLVLDFRARRCRGPPRRLAQPYKLGELRVELAVEETGLEQVTLDLAARGLRYSLDRHDVCNLETR